MSAAARTRILPVAEIFAFDRVEVVGVEAVVTVLIGDEKCAPHSHGLRAPGSRWAEIVRGLGADPALRALMIEALNTPAPEQPRRCYGPRVCVERAAVEPITAYAPAGDRPASEDRDNAFFRRPVTKPGGAIL